MFKWFELFLNNSKAVGALLLILFSSLGVTGWTVFDQQQELTQLRPVEIPVNSGLKELEIDVDKLKRWHE